MARLIILDAGPLNDAAGSLGRRLSDDCRVWLAARVSDGATIVIPEIADYEVRRGFLHLLMKRAPQVTMLANIQRLDELKVVHRYEPITTAAMLLAAELWARAKFQGIPTAPPEALGADTILVAMAWGLVDQGHDVTIATGDKDITRFPDIDARHWTTID